MACLSVSLSLPSKTAVFWPSSAVTSTSSSNSHVRCTISRPQAHMPPLTSRRGTRGIRGRLQVVCMAPEEEKLTRRNPLDFPIEWERPKPGRRPDIFPQFSPMKMPLPPPLPADPPEEDEEEEEEEEKKEEEEENPEKENPVKRPEEL